MRHCNRWEMSNEHVPQLSHKQAQHQIIHTRQHQFYHFYYSRLFYQDTPNFLASSNVTIRLSFHFVGMLIDDGERLPYLHCPLTNYLKIFCVVWSSRFLILYQFRKCETFPKLFLSLYSLRSRGNREVNYVIWLAIKSV